MSRGKYYLCYNFLGDIFEHTNKRFTGRCGFNSAAGGRCSADNAKKIQLSGNRNTASY